MTNPATSAVSRVSHSGFRNHEQHGQQRPPRLVGARLGACAALLTLAGCGSSSPSSDSTILGSGGALGTVVAATGGNSASGSDAGASAGAAADASRDGSDALGVVVIRRAEVMATGGPVWSLAADALSRTNLVRMAGPVPRHYHPDARHSLIVVEGQVIAMPGDQVVTLAPGDYISIPAGMPHSYDAPNGAALLVSFDSPAYDSSKTVQVAADDNVVRTPTVPQDSADLVVTHRADVTLEGGPVWTLRQDAASRTNLVSFAGTTPRHYHPDARHTIMVLEGEVVALVGTQELTLVPGDFLSIPALLPHNYRVAQGKAWVVSIDAPYYDSAKTVQVAP